MIYWIGHESLRNSSESTNRVRSGLEFGYGNNREVLVWLEWVVQKVYVIEGLSYDLVWCQNSLGGEVDNERKCDNLRQIVWIQG